ncbi:MAG: S8 family peptidase [Solirubrobacteraceae bacterium]
MRASALARGGQVAAIVLIGAALSPTTVFAETAITTQAQADHGAFLAYAPPPTQPGGLCLVDTGVNLNPDTESSVVERTAIGGGSGEDLSPTRHGTTMAMMASAPANGWGMVGTAPNATRIVSVGILDAGQTTFPFSSYARGITDCLKMRRRFDIRVINLSLGTSEVPSSEGYEALGNSIAEATDYGVAVVAAAGNDNGGPVEYPAAYPGVLSVGASNALTGEWCSFSNRGEGLALIAPGCELDAANPLSGEPAENYWQGSSEASAIAAAALDALESYAPELSAQAAEEDLTQADGGVLDIAQAFRDTGLSSIVSAGEAAEPTARVIAPSITSATAPSTTTSTSTTPAAAAPSVDRASQPQSVPPSRTMKRFTEFARPTARLMRAGQRWQLTLKARPAEAQVQVRYFARRGRGNKLRILRTLRGSFTRLKLHCTGVSEISVRYADPYDLQRDSRWLTLKVPSVKQRDKRATRA